MTTGRHLVVMTEEKAKVLAAEVRRVTGHNVEVCAEDGHFVVQVRRVVQGDCYTLRDDDDWQWLRKRTRHRV
jgi:16S rRNA U1498 N3-methylase RsmE